MQVRRCLAAAALIAVACQKAETFEQESVRMQAQSDSAKAWMDQAAPAYARHMMAGHADSIAAYFGNNARMMPPNMTPVTGRDNIRQALAGMLSAGPMTNVVLTPVAVHASGSLAVERGRYSMTFMGVADSGTYLNHWQKTSGDWKLVDQMWNSSLPPQAPAPAARR